MGWRDELKIGSFRGVEFYTNSDSVSVGRRIARHEFPQRAIPYMEDMGRKAREYRFDAFVIGDDYKIDRDDLIEAIETKGPGQLVHPRFNTIEVVVTDCEINYSTQAGGMARFSITFIEAGEQIEPNTAVDTEHVLSNQIDESNASIAADFSDNFSIEDAPDYVVSDALGVMNSLLTLPAMDLGQLDSIRATTDSALRALLPENLLSSLSSPSSLASAVQALISQATSLTDLFNFNVPTIATSINTPSRTMQNNNRVAMGNLIQHTAAVKRISDLATQEVETIDDARLARDEIVKRADDVLLDETTQQATAEAVIQLRTDAVENFANITADLPRLVSVTLKAVQPSLVVAYDWYGEDYLIDDREAELIARNKIRHPGFVDAGRTIYLLGE